MAQPRNAVLGQLISSVVGIAIAKLFGKAAGEDPDKHHQLTWLAGSLSCACAVSLMGLTGTVHPPAGATALLAVVDTDIAGLGWFLLPVITLGCVLMQAVALLINNVQRRFPVYWWSPEETGHWWRQQRRRHQHKDEERGKQGEGEGEGETDSDRGARFERVASHASHTSHQHSERGARFERVVSRSSHATDQDAGERGTPTEVKGEAESESRVLITRGMVHVPDDLYITQEERMFLEELSERL